MNVVHVRRSAKCHASIIHEVVNDAVRRCVVLAKRNAHGLVNIRENVVFHVELLATDFRVIFDVKNNSVVDVVALLFVENVARLESFVEFTVSKRTSRRYRFWRVRNAIF